MGALKVWDGTAWVVVGGPSAPLGSMMLYAGESTPPGWLRVDGTTFSAVTYPDLYNFLGGSTLPYRAPEWPDDIAPYAGSVQQAAAGWSVTSESYQGISGNMVTFDVTFQRTGAALNLSNPDHNNQAMSTQMGLGRYQPEHVCTFPASNLKHVFMAGDGALTVTSSLNDSVYTNSNIATGDNVRVTGTYRCIPPSNIDGLRFHWIIRAA